MSLVASAILAGNLAVAQTIVLYSNDFETPNVPLMVNCGNSLDARTIDSLYGAPGFSYQQVNTVEGVVIDDPSNLYSDPSGIGGLYALGMLATFQDDMLALTFDTSGRDFVNVGFHLSSIDVAGCGGPFGTAVPVMQVSLHDTPTGTFNFGSPGTLLARDTVTGTLAPSSYTFAWQYGTVELDARGATTGTVTVVFDLLASGYASFDNLSIVASSTAGIVDRDTDGIADDQDNCPDDANADQADMDGDLAGDVCDPAPLDPLICGDIDGDGADDCMPPPDAGVAEDAAGFDAAPADIGAVADTGADTGSIADTGTLPDAAEPADAGALRDAGAARDGGVDMAEEGGCDCSSGGSDASAAGLQLILGLIGWASVRRRNSTGR